MSMDAAWKVYVGDRRFDDNQISNLYIKLKYETVGRFSFDFRPIDGDETYMVNGNTIRIFWGDLHKLDGVIQRREWDEKQHCYHVYGADLRGFLLDRVNTEPATVNSYTSDVQSYVQYTGCDFPSNVWTGAGDQIGKYTFHYKIGIQNTIRITGATRNRWDTVVERGTVYEHQNGCIYDATKNWATNAFAGATLRFVSGACKNNVYNVNGNTANRVCIRLPGEPISLYSFATDSATCERYTTVGTATYYNLIGNSKFEQGTIDPWVVTPNAGHAEIVTPGYESDSCIHLITSEGAGTGWNSVVVAQPIALTSGKIVTFRYKQRRTNQFDAVYGDIQVFTPAQAELHNIPEFPAGALTNPAWPDWDVATLTFGNQYASSEIRVRGWGLYTSPYELWVDDISMNVATDSNPCGGASGTVPGCSRLGDIYEIVTATMTRIEPASVAPATLEKDNHIIQYNQTDDLSKHTTVVTVRGSD